MNEVIKIPIENNYLYIKFNSSNVHIVDSYKIKTSEQMRYVLRVVRYAAKNYGIMFKRTLESWLREWKAHNVLYKLNIKRSSSQHVDLNEDESRKRKIVYTILSLFYWK